MPPRRHASADALAVPSEVKGFISLNQRGNWLAAQTRPDLSILVSSNQQKMPRPTVGGIRRGNMLARRAQHFADLEIRYPSIPIHELTFILHSDYSSKEMSNMGYTQGGYIIGVTNRDMEKGRVSPWSPSIWRSYRVKRVVKSTLAGESSVMTDGLGHLE